MRRPQPVHVAPQHAQLVDEARRWLEERDARRRRDDREPRRNRPRAFPPLRQ